MNNGEADVHEEPIELFGDPGIASYNGKVPKFLLLTYMTLPIWGGDLPLLFLEWKFWLVGQRSLAAASDSGQHHFPHSESELETGC